MPSTRCSPLGGTTAENTLTSGHRSFDILHIATARLLEATTILTFDRNQRKLAKAAGLSVGP